VRPQLPKRSAKAPAPRTPLDPGRFPEQDQSGGIAKRRKVRETNAHVPASRQTLRPVERTARKSKYR
jgi:hypothetical protein